ncbi:MAG TPA: sigma-54 dependent transcriptional regulator [Rhodocyclaceae bacterium]|nr:sigma-54 dependent transcriptional regulator [Rhodocyclaceae bacterium]
MTPRNGVLLDRRGSVSRELCDLTQPDWKFDVVATTEAACRVAAARTASVGIVVFDTSHSWALHEIEALVAQDGLEWIAIVERDSLGAAALPPTALRNFHDFHSLPLDRNRLLVTLGHAWGKAMMWAEQPAGTKDSERYQMTGDSAPMRALFRQIEKIVAVEAPVLIGGESGVGKELVARAIHQYSARQQGPFIAMNCGAIPANLVHAELFGYERGAFTGASQRKIGNVEAADNGVLFLDEIGDLPLDMQANLLRFLQEKTIVRVGSTERIRVNVRVIAATHVDLSEAMSAGRFREDLYYRLNVVHVEVPPLRERGTDVGLIASEIFARNQHQKSAQVKGFSQEAMLAMANYNWPGNVRELINRVQHAMIMSDQRLISAADMGLETVTADTPNARTLGEVRASVEKEFIESSLQKHQYNMSAVARQLGVSRVTLYRLVEKLKIII